MTQRGAKISAVDRAGGQCQNAAMFPSKRCGIRPHFSLAAIAALLPLAGCADQHAAEPNGGGAGIKRTYDRPVPAAPPDGSVTISAEKVEESARTAHWRWTILGDRNWKGLKRDGDALILSSSSPLNTPNGAAGTNAFLLDVTITVDDTVGGRSNLSDQLSLAMITTRLSGEANGTVSGGAAIGSGPFKLGVQRTTADKAAAPALKGVQTLKLPVDQPVLTVTAKETDGSTYSKTFRLKILK